MAGMTTKPKGGARPGAGRKPGYRKPGAGRKVNVYMPPDVEAWLRDQPEGMSGAVARLVREARDLPMSITAGLAPLTVTSVGNPKISDSTKKDPGCVWWSQTCPFRARDGHRAM
jgi:hypothetical protein